MVYNVFPTNQGIILLYPDPDLYETKCASKDVECSGINLDLCLKHFIIYIFADISYKKGKINDTEMYY